MGYWGDPTASPTALLSDSLIGNINMMCMRFVLSSLNLCEDTLETILYKYVKQNKPILVSCSQFWTKMSDYRIVRLSIYINCGLTILLIITKRFKNSMLDPSNASNFFVKYIISIFTYSLIKNRGLMRFFLRYGVFDITFLHCNFVMHMNYFRTFLSFKNFLKFLHM